MKRIYLIDCPGVCPPTSNDSPEDILLKGVVRVENVENPGQYVAAVLKKTKPQHIERTYGVQGFTNATEFLEILARKGGRLLKGGEADVNGVAKMVLNDFLRGKIPWYTSPPAEESGEKGIEGRKGNLGEMGKVSVPPPSVGAGTNRNVDADMTINDGISIDGKYGEVDFEGFDENQDEETDEEGDMQSNASKDEMSEDQDSESADEGGISLHAPG